MKFKPGTRVISTGGKTLGEVQRVVIDPVSKQVTDIVIEKGLFFKEDRIVPLDLVEMADDELVRLRLDEDMLDKLPHFEETNYVYVNEEDSQQYPQVGLLPLYPAVPSPYSPAVPPIPVRRRPPLIKQHERHIEPQEVVIEQDTPVYDVQGEKIGTVEQVFSDPQSHQVTQFVVSEGLLLKEKKNVPISWVSELDDDRILLAVGSGLVDQLPANRA